MSNLPSDAIGHEHRPSGNSGTVYLVGAGPGDPEFLTLRADRLLRQADAVVYDHLVSSGVLDRVRVGAERIYVGKQESLHSLPQKDINSLLVRLAQQGRNVVRLKGATPSSSAAAGVRFEVVPGVTAHHQA